MTSDAKKGGDSAQEVANCFIEFASEVDENDLTNLKLQKLLYFAQGTFLAEKGQPLFNEPIEAWELGPVVRSVYNNFKSCGSFPITAFDEHVKKSILSQEKKEFLSKVWKRWGKYSASYLVSKTHESGSPWKKIFTEGGDKEIPQKLMSEYFSSKLS